MNKVSDDLKSSLTEVGFKIIETPLTEFLKAGGAAKCLTLRVTEPVIPDSHASVQVESRTICMEGHLLDSGLINQALDLIVEGGGSFKVLNFNLGEQRQSTSIAEVKVSTPSHQVMEEIMSQLIDIGAVIPTEDVQDAKLEPVEQNGVAPDNFYVTTIYPTEVRVKGQWIQVENQRMDGAIAITEVDGYIQAKCKVIRDIKIFEKVVVDIVGIRTIRKLSLIHI